MKTLFYLTNKWTSHLTQLLCVLQNCCFEKVRKFLSKLSIQIVFFNVQHIYFRTWWMLIKDWFRYMESISHLREELTLICFERYHGIPYSHRQSRKNMMKTFLMVNTLPQFVRYHLTINICCLLIFIILCKEKKGNPVFIFSKQRIFWYRTHNFSANKLTKKYLLVK